MRTQTLGLLGRVRSLTGPNEELANYEKSLCVDLAGKRLFLLSENFKLARLLRCTTGMLIESFVSPSFLISVCTGCEAYPHERDWVSMLLYSEKRLMSLFLEVSCLVCAIASFDECT